MDSQSPTDIFKPPWSYVIIPITFYPTLKEFILYSIKQLQMVYISQQSCKVDRAERQQLAQGGLVILLVEGEFGTDPSPIF